MKKKAFLLTACFVFIGVAAWAEKHTVTLDPRDFYYYDDQNTMRTLTVVPKIIVRFLRQLSEEEQKRFLVGYSPVSYVADKNAPDSFILEFGQSTTSVRVFEILGAIGGSGIAEGAAVVLVDNIEAVAEGIVLEPKIVTNITTIKDRLRRFGEFTVRQATEEGTRWLLLVDNVKPPLHLYRLTNLAHKDSWVKRAYPKFRFLHDAVIAHMSVEPVSSTLGEHRVLTLSVRIFDPKIDVKEEFLPRFGEGSFRPKSSNSVVSGLLFSALGQRERKEFSDRRSRTIEYQWKFKHYAIGEWTVDGQPVVYEKDGTSSKITATSASFVVPSLIGNLAIDDMPPPKALPLPARITAPVSSSGFKPPQYWFDRWISNPDVAARYSFWAAFIFLGAAVAMASKTVWPAARARVRRSREKDAFLQRIKAECREAQATESYRKLHEAVWEALHAAFPATLSLHPEFDEVKDKVGAALESELLSSLGSIYEGLEVRFRPDFRSDRQTLAALAEKAAMVIEGLEGRIRASFEKEAV